MNRNRNRRRLPEFDPLDARQLMAAGLTASLNHGVLTIRGTIRSDVIDVTVTAASPGKRGNIVTIEGLARTFPAAQVKQISILGGAGDDAIALHNRGSRSIPTRIVGGAGNDTINGVAKFPPTPAPPPTSVANPWPIPTPAPAPVPVPVPPVFATPVVPASSSALSEVERKIFDLTNLERQKAGLSPLKLSDALVQAARIQAGNMARLDLMAHDLPGTDTPSLVDRARAVGYRYFRLAENIAFGYPDANAVVAGWMNSPGHRANILDPNLTEFGVSVALNARGSPYYAQVFGKPG